MDEDFDVTGFGPGTGALIETDDSMELGVIIRANYEGVLLNATHRMDIVGLVTPVERDRLRGALEDTPTVMLRRFAREAGVGFVKSLILSRSELVVICLQDAVDTHNEMASSSAMVPLMRPIESWLPRERIKNIRNSSQYTEETFLRELDFQMDGELE